LPSREHHVFPLTSWAVQAKVAVVDDVVDGGADVIDMEPLA
jgi:hypothetical protein